VKGRRIRQEWKASDWKSGEAPSIVEFTFKSKKNGTELEMVHSRIPARLASEFRQGWVEAYWNPLKEYFEKKKAKP
jgi:activator of HSP90 ATPase